MLESKATIHIVDDDEAVRDSLAFLLQSADFSVKTYGSAVAFLQESDAEIVGCVITDVRMPGISGIELLTRLRAKGSGIPVIVMTGHGDVAMAVDAMKAGAIDFVEKPFEEEVLLGIVTAALERKQEGTRRDAEKAAAEAKIAELSNRERQVLIGLVAGQANKVIAYELGISPRTVEVYRANLMTKMGARSLSELVRMAVIADLSKLADGED